MCSIGFSGPLRTSSNCFSLWSVSAAFNPKWQSKHYFVHWWLPKMVSTNFCYWHQLDRPLEKPYPKLVVDSAVKNFKILLLVREKLTVTGFRMWQNDSAVLLWCHLQYFKKDVISADTFHQHGSFSGGLLSNVNIRYSLSNVKETLLWEIISGKLN